MKSAEFFSVNHSWEKAFVEVNAQNLHLRKMLQLNDVTICLDKLDNKKNSKISFYQDPLIYRCSIQSRFDFVHHIHNPNTNTFNPILNLIKLNFYCQKFDVSITDQQLPMVIRLIELIIAIVDGTLKLPDVPDSKSLESSILNPNIQRPDAEIHSSSPIKQVKTGESMNSTELLSEKMDVLDIVHNEDQGWMSWAWSYVPAVLGEDDDEIIPETLNEQIIESKHVEVNIGVYFDEFNISFKVRELCFQIFNLDYFGLVVIGVAHIFVRL